MKSHDRDARRYSGWLYAIVLTLVTVLSTALVGPVPASAQRDALVGKVTSFTLDNGLQVVVIEDHRVPVVTHMVWYKVGAVDDPQGKSGIAHLLEHLMFKSCDTKTSDCTESFATKISRLGAIDNATTEHDTTYYFQRADKDKLRELMTLEADRMNGLYVKDEEVLTELDVVRAERRSNIEGDTIKLLAEQMNASLYINHSYGRPTIGWAHEILGLTPEDARTAYDRFYTPANAVLIVAGDVVPEDVRALANETYGKIETGQAVPERVAISEPDPIAARRVVLADQRVPQPALFRSYLVPSYRTASPGQAEGLDVLMAILGSGETSRLHKALVTDSRTALGVGARYQGQNRDSGRVVFFAIVPTADALAKTEAQIDQVIAEVIEGGVKDEELARAKITIEARLVIESDNQLELAKRYGQALAIGRTIEDVSTVADRIQKVTKADVEAAARAFLLKKRSVTGLLMPSAAKDKTQ